MHKCFLHLEIIPFTAFPTRITILHRFLPCVCGVNNCSILQPSRQTWEFGTSWTAMDAQTLPHTTAPLHHPQASFPTYTHSVTRARTHTAGKNAYKHNRQRAAVQDKHGFNTTKTSRSLRLQHLQECVSANLQNLPENALRVNVEVGPGTLFQHLQRIAKVRSHNVHLEYHVLRARSSLRIARSRTSVDWSRCLQTWKNLKGAYQLCPVHTHTHWERVRVSGAFDH